MTTAILSILFIVPAIGFIHHILNATLPLRDEEAYQLWKFNADTTNIKTTYKTSNFADYI